MTEPGPETASEPGPDRRLLVGQLRAAGCVWADEEATLLLAAARSRAELDAMLARRVAGEPLEQVVGRAEFGGVRVLVAPGVFVPRRRSEHLVDVAARLVRAKTDPSGRRSDWSAPYLTVLDLCAGTGALGLALHLRAGPFRLVAVDIDPAAVACAEQNLASVGGIARQGDLFEGVPRELFGRIDVVLANAPYVPTSEMALLPREAREHEPALALDGGADGLAVHRRLVSQAPRWLARGGAVLIEVAAGQAPTALALMTSSGLSAEKYPAPDDPGTVVIVGQRREYRRLPRHP